MKKSIKTLAQTEALAQQYLKAKKGKKKTNDNTPHTIHIKPTQGIGTILTEVIMPKKKKELKPNPSMEEIHDFALWMAEAKNSVRKYEADYYSDNIRLSVHNVLLDDDGKAMKNILRVHSETKEIQANRELFRRSNLFVYFWIVWGASIENNDYKAVDALAFEQLMIAFPFAKAKDLKEFASEFMWVLKDSPSPSNINRVNRIVNLIKAHLASKKKSSTGIYALTGDWKEDTGIEMKVPHPIKGHVIFSNITLREREVLEDYILCKRTLKQMQPFVSANVQKFNSMDVDLPKKFQKAIADRKAKSKNKRK